jgi:hypothetical protein
MGRITEHSDEQVAMMNQPKIDRHVDLPTMHMNGGSMTSSSMEPASQAITARNSPVSFVTSRMSDCQADETEGDCLKAFEQYPAP